MTLLHATFTTSRTLHGVRLRLGILLWMLSWVPYGIILGLDGLWFTLAWVFEIALGLIGLALAGTEFAQAVKTCGWRHAPKVAWKALIHGTDVEAAPS